MHVYDEINVAAVHEYDKNNIYQYVDGVAIYISSKCQFTEIQII